MSDQAFYKWKMMSFPSGEMPDFATYYEKLIDLLKSDKPFSLVRICDGEIYVMAFKKSVNGSISPEHVEHLSNSLQSLVDMTEEGGNLLIGLQENTIWNAKMHITDYTNHLSGQIKNKIPASLMSWTTVARNFQNIVAEINKSERPLILVGPAHLKNLKLFKEYEIITVPSVKCWEHEINIQEKLSDLISQKKNPIVLYSASILTKNLILKNYLLFGDDMIQLDLGSNLDPYCGVNSRPWHSYI